MQKQFQTTTKATPSSKHITTLIPTLDGRLKGGKAKIEVLLGSAGIVVISTDTKTSEIFHVQSFKFKAITHHQEILLTANGPMFTTEMRNLIKQLQPNDYVVIEEIKIQGNTFVQVMKSNIVFEII